METGNSSSSSSWTSSTALAVAGLALLAICSFHLLFRRGRRGGKPRQYAPVAGTVLHQLYHVRRLHDYHTDLFRERKTFQLLTPVGRRHIYTCDPAVVEYILKKNFANYGKFSLLTCISSEQREQGTFNYENTRDLFGDGIFAVDGDKWKQQRKIASYDFSTRALRDTSGAVFKRNAAKLAGIVSSCAASQQSMDFQGLVLKATMDSIFTIAFGLDLNTLGGSAEGSRFAAAFDDASEFTLLRYINPFWKVMKLLHVGAEAALKERIEIVDEFVYKRIRSRAQELSNAKAQDTNMKQDILSRFIETTADESGTVDYKYLRDIILNIAIAGKDTTAGALAWFLYMACKHPEVQEKICQEDNKQCFEDDVLPDGSSVSKGDIVFYVPYAMGRMEYLWGRDAEVFRPERWLSENGEFQPENPFKFTAFQAGPRICLGKEFAYRQMKIFAAVLLRFFVFRLRDGENASVNYRIMLTLPIEQGLHLTATAR
ncbi:hypothetical protein EJB05_23642, partial [Eragrostis curvula]